MGIALRSRRPDESALVASLRAGDERAFMHLVEEYTPGMRRLALTYVRTPALADEVVQEAWLGVLKGLDRFEGRSSLRTWIYTIVANVARTRAVREARSVPFSSLAPADAGDDEAAVDPDRFVAEGHWSRPIEPWRRVVDAEARGVIDAAIARLPPLQAQVIELRDIEGWSSEEVRNVLNISETNQRVLLHRARSKVRAALEEYLNDDG
ncbi:MAG TPA: RNA polymerase sigma factor [Gaiellaceae bacterium]|jgi:RNA polymerase sigma-70 factor (ECF subfamily)